VLGGTLSAIDGIRPEDLNIEGLVRRANEGDVAEIILAMNATIDGQTTAHYITDQLKGSGASISRLAHGVPVGGELDYLDDGTITAAMKSRRRREFKDSVPAVQLFAPYSRVMVMHIVVLFGAFLIEFLGSPIYAVVLLVVIKIVIDIAAHIREGREARALESLQAASDSARAD